MTPPSLWTFACELYAKPRVAPACLHLQDSYGIDVPLLLFCCWSGRYYGELSSNYLQPALRFSREWAEKTTEPLRAIRRAMKDHYQPGCLIAEVDWDDFREQVKALELTSEKLMLEGLNKPLAELPGVDGSPAAVLAHIQYCFQLEIDDKVSELLNPLLKMVFDGGGAISDFNPINIALAGKIE